MPNTIHHEHAELRRIMRDFAILTKRGDGAARAELIQMRFDFSRVFREHLSTVDAVVRMRRKGADGNRAARIAQECAATMRLLYSDYSAHLRRWTPRDIAVDMATYRHDVGILQRRLLDLMAREERELAPLLIHVAA